MGVHSDEYYGRSWNDYLGRLAGDQGWTMDRLGRLSSEQLGDLRNGNHANAPQELVRAAHNLLGCEWLG